MKVNQVNDERLGKGVKGILLASHLAGHANVRETLQSYFSASDEEGEFLKDIFTLKTPEIIEKWYGGAEKANNLIMELTKERDA